MRSWVPILIAAVLCGQVSAQIVQNYDLRAITRTDGVIPVGDGSKFVGEGGATARASLGLAIGTNVQAYDADLTTWAGVSPSANGQSLVSAANYAAMRGLLDLEVGTDLQAYDADLSAIGGLAVTDGNIIVGNGTTWVAESGATARTSLGLGTIATQAAGSVAITGGAIDGTTIGNTSRDYGYFSYAVVTNDVNVGTNDSVRGTFRAYGDSATNGGRVAVYNAASADTTVEYYEIRANDALEIGRSTYVDLSIGNTGIVSLTKGRVNTASAGLIGSDVPLAVGSTETSGLAELLGLYNNAGENLILSFDEDTDQWLWRAGGTKRPVSICMYSVPKFTVGTDDTVTLPGDGYKLALGAAGATDSYLQYTGSTLDVYAVGGLSLRQAANSVGLHVYGYGGSAASNLHLTVDTSGSSWISASGAMQLASASNVMIRAAAASPLYLDSGDKFFWRDADDSFATRATLDSATGAFDAEGSIMFKPGSSVTPADNGDVTFELTNDTTLTVKAKGSDGTVRSVALTLAP